MKQIYYNGEIITLENESVEAVLVEDGKIIKTGTQKELFDVIQGQEIEQIDLEGACLMPAFIDSHSHITSLAKKLGESEEITTEQMIKLVKKAEKIYASYGITTVQDGLTREEEYNILKNMADREMLNLDIISYVDIKNSKNIVERNRRLVGKYFNHYKIGGYKLFLDGSLQEKTAWISSPYEGENEYCGNAIYKTYQVEDFVQNSVDEEMQLITHCNGDAAAEQLIRAFERIGAFENFRPVMLHAQLVRKDQISRMKKIDMIPSFFVSDIYYLGDTYMKIFGQRAEEISPIKSALENEVIYTMHQNTPTLYPNMFEAIWCAVKRETKKEVELGKEQKISILDAIKGVTINAAYQYFEENEKGSIKPGKNADFIIIDKNPLKINIDEIKNINILYTIKDGQVIYRRQGE